MYEEFHAKNGRPYLQGDCRVCGHAYIGGGARLVVICSTGAGHEDGEDFMNLVREGRSNQALVPGKSPEACTMEECPWVGCPSIFDRQSEVDRRGPGGKGPAG